MAKTKQITLSFGFEEQEVDILFSKGEFAVFGCLIKGVPVYNIVYIKQQFVIASQIPDFEKAKSYCKELDKAFSDEVMKTLEQMQELNQFVKPKVKDKNVEKTLKIMNDCLYYIRYAMSSIDGPLPEEMFNSFQKNERENAE